MTNRVELVERTRRGTPRIHLKSDLMDYWAERVLARILPGDALFGERREKHSALMHGDIVYSYGTHFPMAEIHRTPNGRAHMVLLNGDSWGGPSGWGGGTASDQRYVRGLVTTQAEGTNIAVFTVPFSALDAAGIDHASVRPIHVRPDRETFHDYTSSERPGPHVQMEDPSGATYTYEDERWGYFDADGNYVEAGYALSPGEREARGITHRQGTFRARRPVMVDDPNRATVERRYAHGWVHEPATLQPDGTWAWAVHRHWLGDSLFKAASVEARVRSANDAERAELEAYEAWEAEHSRIIANAAGNEDYYAHMEKRPARPTAERVGERVIVRYQVRRWALYLSSFDYNERSAPYFMCELPSGCKPETVEDAVEALKPPEIMAALAAGLDVLRQGDVFAIPTSMTTKELTSRARTTVRLRYEVLPGGDHLVPEEVALRRRADRFDSTGMVSILGTNHEATHLVVTNDGDFYGRGMLYHAPTGWGRSPEHARVKLGDGKTWYRLVKNTVPLDKASGSSRGSVTAGQRVVNQSGQSRAWMLGGAVD